MAKKKSNAVKIGIVAAVVGTIGAVFAGLLSNKRTRSTIVREVKKVEKKVIRKAKKK